MKQDKCRRCKEEIIDGVYCSSCKEIIFQEKVEKQKNRRLSKLRNTIWWGVDKVKAVADGRFWCSTHAGCFRCGDNESPAHIDKKYERWKYHRSLNRTVYTELMLKRGGKPDLIVVDKGFIFIEEIVVSEKEGSLIEKKNKYPFPVVVVKV